MACCIFIFGIIALITWPLQKLGVIKSKPKAMAWQPTSSEPRSVAQKHDMKLSGKHFSLIARAKSFRYAFMGLGHVVKNEHNARIHIVASILIIVAAIYFRLTLRDFAFLTLVIMSVFFAETVNTAFEHLCDVVSPEKNPSVKLAKDVAAGAVLICTIGACVIGAIIFQPYISGEFPLHLSLCQS